MTRTWTRRSALRTVGTTPFVGTFAGVSAADAESAAGRSARARRDAWYTHRHDPANTARNPVASGPSDPPTVDWTTPVDARTESGITVDGQRVYTGERALSAPSGDVLWELAGDSDSSYSAPSLSRSTGRLYTVRTRRSERLSVLGVDPETGEVERTIPVVRTSTSNALAELASEPRVRGGYLYAVVERFARSAPQNQELILYAVDLARGDVRWCESIARCGADALGSDPSLAVGRGRAVVSLAGSVRAYNARTGRRLWVAREIGGPVALGRDRAFVGAPNGPFYALSLADGGVLWRTDRVEQEWSAPGFDGSTGTVYVGTSGSTGALYGDEPGSPLFDDVGKLYAIDAADGSVVSRRPYLEEFPFPFPDDPDAAPNPPFDFNATWGPVGLSQDKLFVGTRAVSFFLRDALFGEAQDFAAYERAGDGGIGDRLWSVSDDPGLSLGELAVVDDALYRRTGSGAIAYR